MRRPPRERPLPEIAILATVLACAGLGGAIGGIAGLLRGVAATRGVHVEALVALVVLHTIGAAVAVRLAGAPPRRAMVVIVLGDAALWLAFGVTFAATVQWRLLGDVLGVALVNAPIAAALGVALLLGVRAWRRRRPIGPRCPACAYELAGVAERRCPECGRAFTLEELGIDADELRAPTRRSL